MHNANVANMLMHWLIASFAVAHQHVSVCMGGQLSTLIANT